MPSLKVFVIRNVYRAVFEPEAGVMSAVIAGRKFFAKDHSDFMHVVMLYIVCYGVNARLLALLAWFVFVFCCCHSVV